MTKTKVIFLCKNNVGRSQMAEAFFNNLAKSHSATSAGFDPAQEWEGFDLSKTKDVAPVMAEAGIDVTMKISKRITKQMVDDSDIIIVIGEKDSWPDYLKDQDLVYWNVQDPDKRNRAYHVEVRDKIESNVKDLLKKIES